MVIVNLNNHLSLLPWSCLLRLVHQPSNAKTTLMTKLHHGSAHPNIPPMLMKYAFTKAKTITFVPNVFTMAPGRQIIDTLSIVLNVQKKSRQHSKNVIPTLIKSISSKNWLECLLNHIGITNKKQSWSVWTLTMMSCKSTPKKGIGRIFSETDLVDLHHFKYPHVPQPPTYNCGNLTLNFCIGSPKFVHLLMDVAILPFGLPIYLKGDHHALILDIGSCIIFGNAIPPLYIAYQQGVTSNAIPTVTKFSKMVSEACDNACINEHLNKLEQLPTLGHSEHDILDDLDNEFTQILVSADTSCQKFQHYSWSPSLHNAYLDHRLWLIRLREIRTKWPHTQALHIIQERLGSHFIPLRPPDMVSTYLQCAQHCIWSIRHDSFNKCQQHLNDLLHNAKATNNKERKQLILGLKHAEETSKALFCPGATCTSSHLSRWPHSSPDSYRHWPTQMATSTQYWKMEEHLLEHSWLHFQQAHGTPFMQPPLLDLLGFDGLTPFGDSIYRGEPIPEDLPPLSFC